MIHCIKVLFLCHITTLILIRDWGCDFFSFIFDNNGIQSSLTVRQFSH